MRVVVQRVKEARVEIDQVCVGQIKHGFLLFVGIHAQDTQEDVEYLVRKLVNLRIFEDDQGKMNQSIQTVHGGILSISQFTLYADTKKGNRPSFIQAARPEVAIPLYDAFNQKLRDHSIQVETGQFGAEMQVSLINDGPVTILFDTTE